MTDNQLYAVQAIAEKQWSEEKEDAVGFEHNGQWITNPWIDPSGRFVQTSYMAVGRYGKENFTQFCKDVVEHYGLKTLFKDAPAPWPEDSDGTIIGLMTAWGSDDYSIESLELTDDAQDALYTLAEPYCTGSVRGNKKAIIKELQQSLI